MNIDSTASFDQSQARSLSAAPAAVTAPPDAYALLLDAMRLIVESPNPGMAVERVAAYMRAHHGLSQLIVEMRAGSSLRRDTYGDLPASGAASGQTARPLQRVVVSMPQPECRGSITFAFAAHSPPVPRDVLQTLADSLALRFADDSLRRRAQDAEQTVARRLRGVTANAEVGQALAPASSEQTLQSIVGQAARIMDAQTCSLLLLDARRQNLHIAASHGLAPDTRAQKQLLGESIAGRVAQSQEPLLIGKSMPRDARLQGIKLKAEAGSAMLTPLKDRENVVLGVLCVRRPAGKPEFSVEEAQLFAAFAAQAALLLVNARLTENLKRREDESLQIAALSRSLLSAIDLDAALQSALESVCRLANCDRGCLYLREADRPVFTPRMLHGYPDHIGRNPVKMGEGAVGLAARVRQTLRFDGGEAITDEMAQTPECRQMRGFARSLGVNAFVALPLLTGANACIGVLVVDNRSQRLPVTPEQLSLLQSFVGQAAIALENARLSEQMQDSAANLRGLKDYTDNVLQSIEAAIITTDERGHVARCNRAAEETLQRPARALRDVPLADALACLKLPDAESAHLLDLARQVQDTGERVHRLKLTLHPQDRAPATVYLMISRLPEHKPTREGGRPGRAGIVIIFEDVTQEERLGAELEKMRRLADIGQLAAKMAHEVRNALTPIKSAAQIIRDDLLSNQPFSSNNPSYNGSGAYSAAEHTPAEFSSSLSFDAAHSSTEWPDMIIAEVDGLSRLTNEMLDFARPASFAPRPITLNIFMRTSVQALASFLEEHRVRLEWRLDPLVTTIYADATQLGQVVRNLVMNAAQAMPDGGTLTLHSVLDATRGQVALRFEDTGCGIPPENLERIFRPFVTTRPKGTGLGLPIAQKIVDHHGGRIEAQSRIGEGTCFTVWLPLMPAMTSMSSIRDELGNAKKLFFRQVLNHTGDSGDIPDKQG